MAPAHVVSEETLRAIVDAFNAHDLDAIMGYFAEDCSLDMPRGPDEWGQRFTGAAAVRDALASRFRGLPDVQLPVELLLLLVVAIMLLQAKRPARFFGYVVMVFAITANWRAGVTPIETARSFFGVNRVVEMADGTHRLLFHGTTIHGAERVRDAAGQSVTGRPIPLTYYYFGGPISEAVEAARNARGSLDRVER